MMKINFSEHALGQMKERGASRQEVKAAIRQGEKVPAKKGRTAFRFNFQYNAVWGNKKYAVKQVMPVAVEEHGTYNIVTVYVFYF
jgi:hypothetical protein